MVRADLPVASEKRRIRHALAFAALLASCFAGCGREPPAPKPQTSGARPAAKAPAPSVTISGDDRAAGLLNWTPPAVDLQPDKLDAAKREAAKAVKEQRWYADAQSAIPLYLAILKIAPDDAAARDGLKRSLAGLLKSGHAILARTDEDEQALAQAHEIAAVARTVDPAAPETILYLTQVDLADRLLQLNEQGESDLRASRLGESTDGALRKFRAVLALRPQQPRAMQGMAAVESGLIRRAEGAAERGEFGAARYWLKLAAAVRPGSATIADAQTRVQATRAMLVSRWHDEGVAALAKPFDGLAVARRKLADVLRIAEPGDAAAADLRERIDSAAHYGLFRPGQSFTDALRDGGRGPQMVVVPHGGFRMGAKDNEPGSTKAEKPSHYVRFERGFAMSRSEVTVAEFRRFMQTGEHRARADRRGHSVVYDERSGNFVRRSGVDWRSDYAGNPAADDAPVLHVSHGDAEAYTEWLTRQSGHRYRLPSEAEFEYAVRAGNDGTWPWGEGRPPAGSGNLTGSLDRSPSGRNWSNAFTGYGDGHWGPAPAGGKPNRYGLYELAGNVSEWTADCWHEGYRRAPSDGRAWINAGCRTRVIRGGSWASSPAQTRSAWRMSASRDITNARLGFRVVRDL